MNKNILYVAVSAIILGMIGYVYVTKTAVHHDPQPPATEESWLFQEGTDKPQPEADKEDAKPSLPPKTYKEALELSKKTNKPMFLFFHADWCKWCKKMESETLSDAKVKEALSSYIVFYVDADNEKDVAEKYNVGGLPSYYVADGSEAVKKEGSGFKNVNQFLSWLGAEKEKRHLFDRNKI